MWAMGLDGGLSGNPMHCGILDDEFKSSVTAYSGAVRKSHHQIWDSSFEARLQPDGALIMVMTRWVEEDLAGWVLDKEKYDPQNWKILCFPAIKENERIFDFPESCNVHEDKREDREALWADKFTFEVMNGRRKRTVPHIWESVYQQSPREDSGLGHVCKEFTTANLHEDIADPGPPLPLEIGMDFNVDPMTAVIGVLIGGQIHYVDEIVAHDSHTQEICVEISRRYPGRYIRVYPDPTGIARKTSARGHTDFGIIESFGFEIVSPTAPYAVVDRVNTFNAACMNELVFIHPHRCPQYVKALRKLTYKPGTKEIDKTRGFDHIFDAGSFPIMNLLPMTDPGTVLNMDSIQL